MEKKGDILNQLAIISDLLENANIDCDDITATIVLKEKQFLKVWKLVNEKMHIKSSDNVNTFSLKIGVVEFIFNKNNA